MLAWTNRPQKLVANFIKQQLSHGSRNGGSKATPKMYRQPSPPDVKSSPPSLLQREGRRTSNSSESSIGGIDSYEDESVGSKKFTGKDDGNRVRIDSISQITGVRFDDPN